MPRTIPITKQTRQQKRHAEVTIDGKKVNAIEYIEQAARKLPPFIRRENGERVNHEAEMKAIYMKHGFKGVADYLKALARVNRRDRSRFWIVRQWSRFIIWVKTL